MNFDFIKNNVQLILVVFMIFSVFVGLSCISAAENGSNVCETSDCSHVDLTEGYLSLMMMVMFFHMMEHLKLGF